MDRIDDHGPSDTAEHKNRRDGRLSAAEINNIRRVFVDNTTPVFWVGSNHGASIIKVEPLD
jgi:hypothetical protein